MMYVVYIEDASYVENGRHIDEYLLSNVGDICRGTVHSKTLLKWEYGQVSLSVHTAGSDY